MLRRRYREWRKHWRSKEKSEKSNPASQSFPLLNLPREIREMIYEYARVPVKVDKRDSMLRAWGSAYAQRYLHHDKRLFNPPSAPGAWAGIMSFSGTLPPMALLLTCKQIYNEISDRDFSLLSTMAFEVGPLTPHIDSVCFDAHYEQLVHCQQLQDIEILRVAISLPCVTHYPTLASRTLEDCLSIMTPRAEKLVEVLLSRAKKLKYLVIDWHDEFPNRDEWQFQNKSPILQPFSMLEGVKLVLGDVVMEAKGANAGLEEEMTALLTEALQGLSGAKGTVVMPGIWTEEW